MVFLKIVKGEEITVGNVFYGFEDLWTAIPDVIASDAGEPYCCRMDWPRACKGDFCPVALT
jgi:hypothetical protein